MLMPGAPCTAVLVVTTWIVDADVQMELVLGNAYPCTYSEEKYY